MKLLSLDPTLTRLPAQVVGNAVNAFVERSMGGVGSRKSLRGSARQMCFGSNLTAPFLGRSAENREPNVESISTQGEKNGC